MSLLSPLNPTAHSQARETRAVKRSLETADIPFGNGEFAERTVGGVTPLKETAEPFRGSLPKFGGL